MARNARALIPALFLLVGAGLLAYYVWAQARAGSNATPGGGDVQTVGSAASPTSAGALLRMTMTASPAATATVTALPPASATATTAASATPTVTATSLPLAPPTVPPEAFSITTEQRFGLTAFGEDIVATEPLEIPYSSYADWNARVEPPRPRDVTFWQVIRVRDGEVHTPHGRIDAALAANPGSTWLIGNEPDVVVQDNTKPEDYAEVYHELYTYIKGRDPTALVAIGGVSQPTPLRRAYLDIVLDTYEQRFGQRMPIDVWNVHAFTLREEEGEWGIGIPPGMDDELAIQYEIEDHDDLEILAGNIVAFREWMARRGYADRPLLVSEYGFLMPYDLGFTPSDVASFLYGSFEYFLSARNDTGFAPDDGRLVQWWLWFMLSGPPDDEYAASFLYDRESGQLTEAGEAFKAFVREHGQTSEP